MPFTSQPNHSHGKNEVIGEFPPETAG
jgi:hypothetical protein